jgi:hypothetical protein
MAHKRLNILTPIAALTLASAMVGCGGALDSLTGTSSSSSSSSSSSASSASCSGYVDVISSTVRSNANADAQCSLQIANADSYLSAAKAACASGNTAGAAAYYTQYQQVADYATGVVKTLCPGSSSSSAPTLPVTTYNLFTCLTSSGRLQAAACSTGSSINSAQIGCTWYNAGSNYGSQASCIAARDKLLAAN